MTNDFLELIVKVGKTSTLSFSNVKAYRAISSEDLIRRVNNHSNCKAVIIENIREDELNTVKDFIQSFAVDNEKNVWFYVKDNDDITCGLADELDYEIHLSEESLFKDIFNKTGRIITSNIKLRKELSAMNDDGEDPFDPFAVFEQHSEAEVCSGVDYTETEVVSEVESKLTLDKKEETIEIITDTSDIEVEPIKEVVESIKESPKLTLDKEEHIELEDNSTEVEAIVVEHTYENQEEFKKLQAELNEVKEELKAANSKYSELSEYANGRISELNKLNTMLKGKYNDIVKQYNEFMEDTTVMEDPISLEDYRGIKLDLDDTKELLESAQDKVKELSEVNEENNRVIEQLENDVKTYSEKLARHKEEIVSLNEQIELGAGKSEEIEILTEKLRISEEALEKAKNDAIRSSEIASEEVKKLKNKIGEISEKYEAESYSRRSLAEFADSLAIKYVDAIKMIDDLNIEIANQNNTIEGLKGDSDNIIISQGNDIKMLRQQIDELVDEKENLNSQIKSGNEAIERIRNEYEMQIGMLREQVQFAESKYARLEQAAYVSDATQLAEQNKTLEDININLRSQLRAKSEELERGVRERAELNATIRKLNEDKNGLSNTIKTMTNGMQGGISQKIMIPKINYNGKNFVIPVFGSGSYGTTTTAMSLAYKFAEKASTLYIDFDLVSPKCDVWFRKPPLCNIPNSYDNGKDYSTSLGIFFEKGARYFLDNYGHIVFNRLKTKYGTLDYLTGVYAKIDTYKFMAADFSTLLTSLGNTYQYVIIDMGRLGSSELTDAIIAGITRAVCERGNRCVAVTTPNNIEVRNLRKKIMEVGIDISSIAWLVNMSKSNKIDDKALKNIRPALASTMIFDPDLYGLTQTFQEENRSRNKALEQFISNCIYATR